MSTKCTIRYGDQFHLYQDCFDEDNVELKIENVPFESSASASGTSVTLVIPIKLAQEIGLLTDKDWVQLPSPPTES
jgi:hypothetical protein